MGQHCAFLTAALLPTDSEQKMLQELRAKRSDAALRLVHDPRERNKRPKESKMQSCRASRRSILLNPSRLPRCHATFLRYCWEDSSHELMAIHHLPCAHPKFWLYNVSYLQNLVCFSSLPRALWPILFEAMAASFSQHHDTPA